MFKNQQKIIFYFLFILLIINNLINAKYPNEIIDTPIVNCEHESISIKIHPLFVTDSDRSYCAQCVYMEANLVDDLERVHAAVVGETVFHVWQCSSENVGILVQNCHVEDLQGDKILIIDQNGCGVDQYLFKTPQYSSDLHTAFLQSSVFKFVDKSMTRFRCQLRLCVKNRGRGCSSTTPPTTCPSIEDPLEDSDSPLAPGTGPSSPAPQSSPASGSAAVLGLGSPPSLSPTVEQILQRPSAFPVPSERSETVGPPSIGRDALNIPQDITLVSGSGGGNNIVTHFYTKGEGGGGYSSPSTTTTTTTQKSPNTSWAAADQPVGPPSIRPYGPGRPISALSGTQIVSGKTEQPTNISPYRQRRSLSSFQIINGIGKFKNKRSKRKTNREEGVQELLDVVGLIRVLDNSDDIQYFVDQNRTSSSTKFLNKNIFSKNSERKINNLLSTTTLINNLIPDYDLLLPLNKERKNNESNNVKLVKINNKNKRRIYSKIERNGFSFKNIFCKNYFYFKEFPNNEKLLKSTNIEFKKQNEKLEICLSNSTFWLIIFSLIFLLIIQFSIMTLLAIDRLFKKNGGLFNKKIKKTFLENLN
ncbi:unnamed protein product [Meloidogyne enterolobii]|uniref:Uncharacterized protein n=1 Tax=Meloidogyne enterolobii TaxID=390850 RepID=A0ACB0Y367_MELEN